MANSTKVRKETQAKVRVKDGLSLRAFGRLLGVSVQAIRKGIRSGRLRLSLGKTSTGQPCVVDIELAKAEWTSKGQAGDVISATTLVEAQRHATLERARKLRMENEVTEGRLVAVGQVAKEAFESARIIREAFLNLPARLAGELAAETDAAKIHLRLEREIHACLTAGADAVQARVAHA